MIYNLLSLLAGALISVMVAANGGLTEVYGVYPATIIIHIAGLIFISAFVLIKRENPFAAKCAWYLYLGGALGVLTTLANNIAFGRISVSEILAIGLFGQCAASLVYDQFGFMGMAKRPFRAQRIIGFIIILAGIAVMTDRFDALAMSVSFAAGINIVVSRTINAKLSEYKGVRGGTFFNYLIGLAVAAPVCLVLGGGFPAFEFSPNVFIYLGGIFGVCIVLVCNIAVAKVSSFYLTLLMFIGQVFTGVLVDAVIKQEFSLKILLGGVFVTAGLCADLLLDGKKNVDKSI